MNAEDELLKAFKLVEEYNNQKPVIVKEYRLYYNDDGTIVGLWETEHPPGENYIVLDNPDIFHKNNSQLIRVINKELKILDFRKPLKSGIQKSATGQPVVAGLAAIALAPEESHSSIEHYDRKDN